MEDIINKVINSVTSDDILEFNSRKYKKINSTTKYYSSYFLKVDDDINFKSREFSWFSTEKNQSILHLFDMSRREYNLDDLLQPRLYEVTFTDDEDKYLINSQNVDNKDIFNGILSEKIIKKFENIENFNFIGDNNKYILYILQQLHLKQFLPNIIGYANDYDQNEIGILKIGLNFKNLSIFILEQINRVTLSQCLQYFFNFNKSKYINEQGKDVIDIIEEEINSEFIDVKQNLNNDKKLYLKIGWQIMKIVMSRSENIELHEKIFNITSHYCNFNNNKIQFPLKYNDINKQFFYKNKNDKYVFKYSTDYCIYNESIRTKCFIINQAIVNITFKKSDSDEKLIIKFIEDEGDSGKRHVDKNESSEQNNTNPNKRSKNQQKYMKYKKKYLKLKEQLQKMKIN
jgi:hypothetical protein